MNAQPRTRAPRAVWFPDWFQVLQQTDLPESARSQYRTVVLEFLRFCKQTRQAATIPAARQFIRDRQAQRVLSEPDRLQWQEALNWFFREAGQRRHPPAAPPRPPACRLQRPGRPGAHGSTDTRGG